MDCTIEIYGPVARIDGHFPARLVFDALSYPVEGARFSKAYKKGLWDGRKYLINKATYAFPTGLLDTVLDILKAENITYEINDQRVHHKPVTKDFTLKGVNMSGKYAYQLDAVKTAIKQKQGIIRMATGGGKTEVSCAITKYIGLPTLFIVTTRELLYQARERFMARLGVGKDQIGLVGDGKWQPGDWVTIATADTLESRFNTDECQALLKDTKVLFVDECHHAGSETWYNVCMACPAYYRFGLSGTPLDRTDGANLRLIAALGPVIVDISNKLLMENGISARTSIIFNRIAEPALPRALNYANAYKLGVVKNEKQTGLIVDWTKIFIEQGLSILILCEQIEHGKIIDQALWTQADGAFIPHVFIHGSESTEARQDALRDFAERKVPVLVASTILDEGVDVPTIDALILAGSRKSRIKTMQRLGRGLRGKKLIAVEFANFTHDYLLKHSLSRWDDYKKEDCFIMKQSGPSAELVKKLWEDSLES